MMIDDFAGRPIAIKVPAKGHAFEHVRGPLWRWVDVNKNPGWLANDVLIAYVASRSPGPRGAIAWRDGDKGPGLLWSQS